MTQGMVTGLVFPFSQARNACDAAQRDGRVVV